MQKFFSLDKLHGQLLIKYRGSVHGTINYTQACVYYTYESRHVSVPVLSKKRSNVSGENNVLGVSSYFVHRQDEVLFIKAALQRHYERSHFENKHRNNDQFDLKT